MKISSTDPGSYWVDICSLNGWMGGRVGHGWVWRIIWKGGEVGSGQRLTGPVQASSSSPSCLSSFTPPSFLCPSLKVPITIHSTAQAEAGILFDDLFPPPTI